MHGRTDPKGCPGDSLSLPATNTTAKMSEEYKYSQRGVSADKSEVHAAIRHLDKGLYPLAFCKILPDVTGHSEAHCNIMHADTAGTKTSLAYLYWRETGDLSVWEGIAQDALVMNLDDMACVGCTQDIVLSSTIGRNKNRIPGEVIATLIRAGLRFVEKMRTYGINLHLAGGETADVGDIVRTVDVGYTTFARPLRSELIINDIRPGDSVVGLASFGKCVYEDSYNSGIGSNGLTGARHDLFAKAYAEKYPESFDPSLPKDVVYTGRYQLTDSVRIGSDMLPVGKLALSPTRTYLPVLKRIFETTERKHLHGIIHCTGGGQAKVLNFIRNRRVVKDHLFVLPPLFEMIHQASGTPWRELYQVFNMGHRLELYVPEMEVDGLIATAEAFGVAAKVVGHVEEAKGESVRIVSPHGTFDFERP